MSEPTGKRLQGKDRADMHTKTTPRNGRKGASISRGFTLIEVLVVVAIIALLISILLPALKAAREEARKVVCSSNMHQVGIGSISYIQSSKNRFPWGPNSTRQFLSHYWGGESDKGDGADSPYWNRYYGPTAGDRHIPASSRPINKYLVGRSLGKNSDADLPVFQCPNDDGVRSRSDFMQPKSTMPSFHVMGTSYDSNGIWRIYAIEKEGASAERLQYLTDRILYLFEKKGASRAVIAYEDPADCTLGGVLYNWHPDLRYMGWHGRPNFYTSLFLDGHSENLYMPHKKVMDYNMSGAGGKINIACNPVSGKCYHGDSRWFVRHDYMQQ